jgi:hypothetical protein
MPASPSLLIVPARFKTGKLYTQIATTSAGVVLGSSGDFNVTRATTATRFNSAGLIESVASGVPRLDYYTSGGTAGCPALLVEPSAQNSALQSQDFTTTWSPTNVTVSANVTGTTDPFGTNLADLLTATASGSARVVQTFSFVSGTTYTYSCFAKAGNGFFGMTMENGGVASGVAVIWNVSTGAFSVSGSVGSGYTLQAHNIENYGNGWYRCSMRVLLGLSVTGNIRVNTSNGTMSSVVVQSDNGNSVNVFGAQVETGSIATSYIPTTAAAVTRNADVITLSGAVSGSIGQTEGTIYLEMQADSAGTGANFLIIGDGVNADDFVYLGKNGANLQAVVRSNNSSVVSFTQALTGNAIKAAIAYKGGDSALYVNGSFVASGSTAFTFSSLLPSIGLGLSSFAFAAPTAINRYRAAALYNTRLTNAELAALTTL